MINNTSKILEQSTLDWLWRLSDKGIMTPFLNEVGEYEFSVNEHYIDMKDKIVRDFENRLEDISSFYLKAKWQ